MAALATCQRQGAVARSPPTTDRIAASERLLVSPASEPLIDSESEGRPVGDAPDIRAEAERLTAAVLAAGLSMRLMGGMAIWLTSPSVREPPFARSYADLDFAAASVDRKRIVPFFVEEGYIAERLFNAIHGAQRLNFAHPSGRWTVDVVYDQLRMSHRIDLRGRLALPGPTIDLADLLLTKLQIWEINEKDLRDSACLLADHPLGDGTETVDPGAIDVERILALVTSDWGLCHTVERNLERLASHPGGWRVHGSAPPGDQARALLERISAAPKSLSWRTRARVGERVRWYETPEEVRHEALNGDAPTLTEVPVPAGTRAPGDAGDSSET